MFPENYLFRIRVMIYIAGTEKIPPVGCATSVQWYLSIS